MKILFYFNWLLGLILVIVGWIDYRFVSASFESSAVMILLGIWLGIIALLIRTKP